MLLVYSVTMETDIFKAATSGQEYANVSCRRQTGMVLKTTRFNDTESFQ